MSRKCYRISEPLWEKTEAELKALFSVISPEAEELEVGGLNAMEVAKLNLAFNTIPGSVTILDLQYSRLAENSGANLADFFAIIPAPVTELQIEGNGLGTMPVAHLKQAIRSLPLPVTVLGLGENFTGEQAWAKLRQAFSVIPTPVTVLNFNNYNTIVEDILTSSSRGRRDIRDVFKRAFPAIPCSVTTLNIGRTFINCLSVEWNESMFSAIPSSVTTLGLEAVGLGVKRGPEIKQIIAAFPRSLIALSLSENNLGVRPAAELVDAFSALPPRLTELNLEQNGFLRWAKKDLELLFECLSKQGISSVGEGKLQDMYESYRALGIQDTLLKAMAEAAKQRPAEGNAEGAVCQAMHDKNSIEYGLARHFERNPGAVHDAGPRIAAFFNPCYAAEREPEPESESEPTFDPGPASRCSVFSTTSAKVSAAVGCGTVFTGFIAALVTASIVTSSTGIGLPIGIACAVAAAVLALWLGVTAGVERACMSTAQP